MKTASLNRAALNAELVASLEAAVVGWGEMVEGLLDDLPLDPQAVAQSTAGPSSELDYWKARASKLSSILEQLRSRECKVILAVLKTARSRVLRSWKAFENAVGDAANEAKDTVKYLGTLEKYIEPLYSAEPLAIIDSLPGLMNSIKMMLTIARFYSTPERMATLLCKIANQLINRCTSFLQATGKLWDQPTEQLFPRLKQCIALDAAYREEFHKCRDALSSAMKSTR